MMAFQICLAPLRGVTDALFRNTYAEFFSGIDWAITPFLSTTQGPRIKPSHLKEVLPENNLKMPVVPQVMSKRAENFIPLAMALMDLGYHTINWNLGCPYPMVAKKGRGSGLLPHPEVIERFLDKVLAVMPGQISVKMRLGRYRDDEIFKLLPIFNRYPLKEVIIHPRTGVQMYEGTVQLDVFEQCLPLCRHCVMYNGDIVDPYGFERLQQRFPEIKSWMIGRGAVSNPFLCSNLKGHNINNDDQNKIFKKFHDALYARYKERLYGPSHLLNRMKGLWGYFVKSFKGGAAFRKKINKTRHVQHYEYLIENFFDAGPKWKKDCSKNEDCSGKQYA
jgi:tRNA-dihydrouridine synthase